TVIGTTQIAIASLALAACSSGPGRGAAQAAPAWSDSDAAAASRPVSGGGITAVTAAGKNGVLQTVVDDLATGKRLWAQPATMAGRPSGMGVEPPAVVPAGGGALVVTIEPGPKTNLVARAARTGA